MADIYIHGKVFIVFVVVIGFPLTFVTCRDDSKMTAVIVPT